MKNFIYSLFERVVYSRGKKRVRNKFVSKLPLKLPGQFVVATKRGLFLINEERLISLLHGEYYGVAFHEGFIICFHKIDNNKGRIIRFSSAIEKNKKVEVLIENLSPGCHQIDVSGDHLYIADTYNNCIKVVDLRTKEEQNFFPIGVLENGRGSKNYGHINSVFVDSESIYIVCHNETSKTNRFSELLELDKQLAVKRVVKTKSGNAHNVIPLEGGLAHCDSMNCSVKISNREVFKASLFTRGFSVSEDCCLIGGSAYAARKDRAKAKGMVYVLNRDFSELGHVDIPGMVQEIRRLDKPDYSLSAYSGLFGDSHAIK